ncbi:MAG: HAD-IA family hydrolase [Thermoplasmata archaeon]
MPRLNAVTLDLWDTLITEIPRKNPGLTRYRIELMHDELEKLGFKYSIGRIEEAYARSEEFCDEVWSRHRDMPLDDHFLFLLSCIDSGLPWKLSKDGLERLRKGYSEAIFRMPPVLLPHAREALEYLSSNGYRIGLISNTGRTPGSVLRTLLAHLGISEYFDVMTFSNEVLVRKPEKQIFLHTLRALGALPRLSLHIGDDPEADFEGARNAGMNALLIDGGKSGSRRNDAVISLKDLPEIL